MNRIIIVLLLLIGLLFAEDKIFQDNKNGFEVKAPGNWNINNEKRGKLIAYSRGDGVTEMSVEVINNTAQKDAFAAAAEQNSAYDSWQFVCGRHMEWNEKKGADNGFSAMYQKAVLRGYNANNKLIVQEGYFVKNRKIYIISLFTDSSHWAEAKDELLFVWNSFRVY